jgi:sulfide:quinone oxidoreductase
VRDAEAKFAAWRAAPGLPFDFDNALPSGSRCLGCPGGPKRILPMQIKPLSPDVSVSQQILPEDVPAAAAAGIRTIINNRPDGEQPDQPDGAAIEAAAIAAGLAYCHIPIVPGRVTPSDVAAMASALSELPKPALAFCRSGTRSAQLWALSQAGNCDVASVIGAAREQGYDLSPLAGVLAGKG